jgi:hypothetical protein
VICIGDYDDTVVNTKGPAAAVAAAVAANDSVARRFIAAFDVNAGGETLLSLSAKLGFVKTVSFLVNVGGGGCGGGSGGGNIDVATPLVAAARSGQIEV